MTSRITNRGVTYTCDNPACGVTFNVPQRSYKVAWPRARDADWIAAKSGDTWLHFCCWVHGPGTRDQLAALVRDPTVDPRLVDHTRARQRSGD